MWPKDRRTKYATQKHLGFPQQRMLMRACLVSFVARSLIAPLYNNAPKFIPPANRSRDRYFDFGREYIGPRSVHCWLK
jgi:hypothetical protein